MQTLRNVTQYLSLAKTVNVAQVFLPSDVKDSIDKLNVDLNTAADTLGQKTNENSGKIRRVFSTVYFSLPWKYHIPDLATFFFSYPIKLLVSIAKCNGFVSGDRHWSQLQLWCFFCPFWVSVCIIEWSHYPFSLYLIYPSLASQYLPLLVTNFYIVFIFYAGLSILGHQNAIHM